MERWLERFARTNFLRSADTAHDLKTPLNVAVLNLELLRMRVRKMTDGSDDARLYEYTASIETELRRMAQIFDTFFLLSTPPKGEGPGAIDVATIYAQAAKDAGIAVHAGEPALVLAHEVRIVQALRLFFESATKLFPTGTLRSAISRNAEQVTISVTGARPEAPDFEPSRVFKFYYTDPAGNPDLSMATARLIIETYGGELNATEESDKVVLRLSLPLGES